MQYPSAYNTSNTISLVREFIALTKPRVNLLIMFTAIVGMLLDFGHNYNSILLGMCILAMFASIALAITMKHAPKLLSNNINKGA